MPSRFEPCGLNQMYSMAYGTPPIVHATGGLADTVVDNDAEPERGTGFVMARADRRGAAGRRWRAPFAPTRQAGLAAPATARHGPLVRLGRQRRGLRRSVPAGAGPAGGRVRSAPRRKRRALWHARCRYVDPVNRHPGHGPPLAQQPSRRGHGPSPRRQRPGAAVRSLIDLALLLSGAVWVWAAVAVAGPRWPNSSARRSVGWPQACSASPPCWRSPARCAGARCFERTVVFCRGDVRERRPEHGHGRCRHRSVASQPRPFQMGGQENSCISCRRDAAIITAAMIGTEMTALMTADQ